MTAAYQGKKFTRKQLVFIVERILDGAMDQIQSGAPDSIQHEERIEIHDSSKFSSYELGVINGCGMSLACFYAGLTDDGLAGGDALGSAGDFDKACEKFLTTVWRDEGKAFSAKYAEMMSNGNRATFPEIYNAAFPGIFPDTRKHAEAFVDSVFDVYLGKESERTQN